ncbi:RING-H2 finger protein ATL7 [Orchesella cincta]|uniref:RING-H2 finger protein ATL7 n=1 Tax=Orchesella cincta TaxID=48709 RepID=A0A1D2MEP3_ORCCI|nr:RING-H2 finger protein ATL7 [Orchesella cincta]
MVKPYGVERKVSRIPRPTSATSKKSKWAKCFIGAASTQQRTNHSNLVSTGTGTSTTSFFCPSTPRPSSASPSTTPTKRQCAASFSTSNNALRNVELQRNPAQIKPSLARAEENLNLINRPPGYGSDVASALPRNIYNITFDCPICIGSLVHSGGIHNPKEGGSKGNVVTHCGHLFHRECMESWLRIKGNNRCPICSTLCVPETLQSVYLECNVSVDENSRTILAKEISKFDQNRTVNEAFQVLKSEYDILKARFDEMIAENEEFSSKQQ